MTTPDPDPRPAPTSAPGGPRGAGAVEEAPEADGTWKRMHPVTPLVRGWAVLAALLFLVLQQGGGDLLPFGGRGDDGPPRDVLGVAVLVQLGLVGVGALLIAGWAYVTWRVTRFRVGDEVVELRTGVLNRQHRRVRLDRLQAVDVVQPLVARLTGLSELKLEVAGGSGSDVSLAYLRSAEAQRLRRTLLARAAGVRVEEGQEAPEAPEREVLQVPVDRLVGSMVRSGWTVAVALVVVAAVVAVVVTGSPGFLVGGLPAAFGVAAGLWGSFSRGFGFRIAASPDGLRLRHGLTETRAQTVPPGRVQAIRLSQPLLWRGPDWWTLQMDVAGYAGASSEDAGKATVLLPVGTREEAVRVLSLVVPDPGTDDAAAVLRAGLTGTGTAAGWVDAPRSSRWLDPVAWRRNGFRVTGTALLCRRGRLTRQLDVVPHERTQSLSLEQGPLQRRLGVATVVAHATPGPVTPRVDHLGAGAAAALLAEQARRAATARRSAGPERWMTALAAEHEAASPGRPDGGAAVPVAGEQPPSAPPAAPAAAPPGEPPAAVAADGAAPTPDLDAGATSPASDPSLERPGEHDGWARPDGRPTTTEAP